MGLGFRYCYPKEHNPVSCRFGFVIVWRNHKRIDASICTAQATEPVKMHQIVDRNAKTLMLVGKGSYA